MVPVKHNLITTVAGDSNVIFAPMDKLELGVVNLDDYIWLFTAKESFDDPDSAAKVAKYSESGGLRIIGRAAHIDILTVDTETAVAPTTWYCDIRGTHRVTSRKHTGSEFLWKINPYIGKGSAPEIPIYTTEPPHGVPGPVGPAGPTGPQGPQGIVDVKSVTTLPPGSPATVVDADPTPGRAWLDFGIPKGDAGPMGPQGPTGEAGGDDSVTRFWACPVMQIRSDTYFPEIIDLPQVELIGTIQTILTSPAIDDQVGPYMPPRDERFPVWQSTDKLYTMWVTPDNGSGNPGLVLYGYAPFAFPSEWGAWMFFTPGTGTDSVLGLLTYEAVTTQTLLWYFIGQNFGYVSDYLSDAEFHGPLFSSGDPFESSLGGNGAADSGKLLMFGADGGIQASTTNGVAGFFTSDGVGPPISSVSASSIYLAQFHNSQTASSFYVDRDALGLRWVNGLDYTLRLIPMAQTGNKAIYIPDANGTFALTSQLPVTSTGGSGVNDAGKSLIFLSSGGIRATASSGTGVDGRTIGTLSTESGIYAEGAGNAVGITGISVSGYGGVLASASGPGLVAKSDTGTYIAEFWGSFAGSNNLRVVRATMGLSWVLNGRTLTINPPTAATANRFWNFPDAQGTIALIANQTFTTTTLAGATTATGQVELTGQSVTGANSAINRSLSLKEECYAPQHIGFPLSSADTQTTGNAAASLYSSKGISFVMTMVNTSVPGDARTVTIDNPLYPYGSGANMRMLDGRLTYILDLNFNGVVGNDFYFSNGVAYGTRLTAAAGWAVRWMNGDQVQLQIHNGTALQTSTPISFNSGNLTMWVVVWDRGTLTLYLRGHGQTIDSDTVRFVQLAQLVGTGVPSTGSGYYTTFKNECVVAGAFRAAALYSARFLRSAVHPNL